MPARLHYDVTFHLVTRNRKAQDDIVTALLDDVPRALRMLRTLRSLAQVKIVRRPRTLVHDDTAPPMPTSAEAICHSGLSGESPLSASRRVKTLARYSRCVWSFCSRNKPTKAICSIWRNLRSTKWCRWAGSGRRRNHPPEPGKARPSGKG